jgi:hypothetical protein
MVAVGLANLMKPNERKRAAPCTHRLSSKAATKAAAADAIYARQTVYQAQPSHMQYIKPSTPYEIYGNMDARELALKIGHENRTPV